MLKDFCVISTRFSVGFLQEIIIIIFMIIIIIIGMIIGIIICKNEETDNMKNMCMYVMST